MKLEQQLGQRRGYLHMGNPKLFQLRWSLIKKKWDLHVYDVCAYWRYLGIATAE